MLGGDNGVIRWNQVTVPHKHQSGKTRTTSLGNTYTTVLSFSHAYNQHFHTNASYFLAETRLSRSEGPPRCRLSFCAGDLRLGPVQNLQELCDTMTHSRVQVCFRALDVVVEVISEELDSVDGREGLGRVGKVSRREDCSQRWDH